MPRYFFNIIEGDSKRLVLDDREGIVLASVEEARKEAIGLARDIVRHRVRTSNETRKVIVSDANENEVLTVLLSQVRGRARWVSLDLGSRIARFKSKLGLRSLAWLFAPFLAIIVQIAVAAWQVGEPNGRYEIASAPTEGSVVAVRFASRANVAEITQLLDAYSASVIGGPGPGGFYRLRIADGAVSRQGLAKIVARIAQEKIVEIAAPVH